MNTFFKSTAELYPIDKIVSVIVEIVESDIKKVYDSDYLYYDSYIDGPHSVYRDELVKETNLHKILGSIRDGKCLVLEVANIIIVVSYINELNMFIMVSNEVIDISKRYIVGSYMHTLCSQYESLSRYSFHYS